MKKLVTLFVGLLGILLFTQSVTHSIFDGLTEVSYGTTNNYSDPIVSGVELAVDTEGNSVAAINSAGNIIGLNIFAGDMDSGTNVNQLFSNALDFVAQAHDPIPEPGAIVLLGLGMVGLVTLRRKVSPKR